MISADTQVALLLLSPAEAEDVAANISAYCPAPVLEPVPLGHVLLLEHMGRAQSSDTVKGQTRRSGLVL